MNVPNKERLKALALDLTRNVPRSPRDTLAGYVIAARTLDKCRALVNGTIGEYHFDCPLDRLFFGFTEIDPERFKDQVAGGAADEDIAAWIEKHAKARTRLDSIKWNNLMRSLRICDLPDPQQEFLEGYIPQFVPQGRPVYCWFDVYDLEEGRL